MLNIFISYSHLDEIIINKFLKHLKTLETNNLAKIWIDRKLKAGEELQESLDFKIEDSDIICLMLSSNFLSSTACLKEKNDALKLRNSKGVSTIPVIVSPCAWTDHKEISRLLVVPTDGKALTTFQNEDEGYLDAYNWIKKIIDDAIIISNLKLQTENEKYLESTDILSKSHQSKESLILDDIFVDTKLIKFDTEDSTKKYNSKKLLDEILTLKKIIVMGDNQSGKTTLSKIIYKHFRKLNLVPIFLVDENNFQGNPLSKLEKAFNEQYLNGDFRNINPKKIIPIIDNFHHAKNQEKYIEQFKNFELQVIFVDDVFTFDLKKQNLVKDYSRFKIREFTALERNELIEKWVKIKEQDKISINPNYLQQSIDEKTELIENALGVLFGKGIMPSYPFFILSLLAAQDTQRPLDQDITSQGNCYQALIYLYLRKEGVKNDQIDIYTNFLTELAYFIYNKKQELISGDEFEEFLIEYQKNFNFPIEKTEVIKTLRNVNICKFDSLNQYGFCYSYIFYFFIAKYISDNISSKTQLIIELIQNLHKDENAYITIFIAHHTKSNILLDEIGLAAEILFEKYLPASLDSTELLKFDKYEDTIIKALLPNYQHNSNEERNRILETKSKIEEDKESLQNSLVNKMDSNKSENDDETEKFLTELRLALKTVEVMGLIIKNRSGSLGLDKLAYIYDQGMKVNLRIMTFFIQLVNDENEVKIMFDYLKDRINKIIKDQDKELSLDKIEKIARNIFWNLNFGIIHGLITKSINSLGSSNLLKISENNYKTENTPASFLVYQGIHMWYGKNLKIDEIANKIKDPKFSKTGINLIKHKVVEHCKLHQINYQDLQRISSTLKIDQKKLINEREKIKHE